MKHIHYISPSGNFRGAPERVIEERHDSNFIKIFIHKNEHLFYYGYQIKIATLIKQKSTNINDAPHPTPDAARLYAVFDIERLCMRHRTVRKLYVNFIKIRNNQQELFGEDRE